MERRVLLAIVLSIGLIFLVQTLFPPAPPPAEPPPTDTVVVGEDTAREEGVGAPDGGEDLPIPPPDAEGVEEGLPRGGDPEPAADEDAADAVDGADAPAPLPNGDVLEADTVLVRTDLYEYAFSTRGAALVGARLLGFESYADGDPEGGPVELVPDDDRFFGYSVVIGRDTVGLETRSFASSSSTLDLTGEEGARDSLTFTHAFPGEGGARFVVTYHFRNGAYLVEARGRLEGLRGRGYALLADLGPGLRSNEQNRDEDLGQRAMVTNREGNGVESISFDDVAEGEARPASGGPFHWVAMKNKYFLAAAIAPDEGPLFGGAVMRGGAAGEVRVATSLPVPGGSRGFELDVYLGPQDYGRLNAIGQHLQDVNTYGYQWLQPVIRPLVAIVMPILVWMHTRFDLAYGWVLILFGVMVRVVLFPLYQKSMRAQIGQMRLQPVVQEIREKYKDDPQKMQQEMMRVYKEEGVNPLAGCLPMMLPMPILFTLFFVFQGTIEFRGVPFMWLPDLSLKDPLYIIPVVMGLSMFLLQWIGQRSMQTTNTQMKVLMYGMPVFLTFLFANFPSGLNLYYTTSNLASLPQQLYIARERKAAGVGQQPATPREPDG